MLVTASGTGSWFEMVSVCWEPIRFLKTFGMVGIVWNGLV